ELVDGPVELCELVAGDQERDVRRHPLVNGGPDLNREGVRKEAFDEPALVLLTLGGQRLRYQLAEADPLVVGRLLGLPVERALDRGDRGALREYLAKDRRLLVDRLDVELDLPLHLVELRPKLAR